MMTSSSTEQEIQQKIQLFDIWALFYDDLVSSIFYKTLHRRLLDYLTLPKTPWVLDLGCGTGRLLDRLANIYPDLFGIGLDVSPEMLRQARKSRRYAPRLLYIKGDAADLPTADQQFDAVFNTISFLHYPDPLQVLSEVYRTLKPEGKYYLIDWIGIPDNGYQEIPIGAGKIRVYSFSKREEMGKQVGFNRIDHHWLLGGVGLTIFEKG